MRCGFSALCQKGGIIAGRAYIGGGGLKPEYFFCLQVDGLYLGKAYNRDFTVYVLLERLSMEFTAEGRGQIPVNISSKYLTGTREQCKVVLVFMVTRNYLPYSLPPRGHGKRSRKLVMWSLLPLPYTRRMLLLRAVFNLVSKIIRI